MGVGRRRRVPGQDLEAVLYDVWKHRMRLSGGTFSVDKSQKFDHLGEISELKWNTSGSDPAVTEITGSMFEDSMRVTIGDFSAEGPKP